MDKNNFFKKDALRPTEEQRLLTKPFYANANEIYRRYSDWKDEDRFYFIPLYLEMTYSINGIVSELAPDPVWLGSFIQTTINHPELFQFQCPEWTWKDTAIAVGKGLNPSPDGSNAARHCVSRLPPTRSAISSTSCCALWLGQQQ